MSRMGVLGRAIAVATPVALLFASIDVWQIAILQPGSLDVRTLAWLLGLWAATAFGATLVLIAALGRRSGPGVTATVAAVMVGVGVWLLAQEVGLQALQPLSPRRPVVAGASVLLGLSVGLGIWLLPRRRRAWLVPAGVAVLVLGAVGATGGIGGRTPGPDRHDGGATDDAPNVVVVLIDTLRADHLGAYGYDRPTSPNIDRFAAEGTLFERAFSQSTWTKPAMASFFTGRYPSQHQTNLERSRLPETEVLLPEVLGHVGYRTAVFSGNPWVTPEYGFDQGVDHFHSVYDDRFARVTLYMRTLKRVSKAVDGRRRVYNRVKNLIDRAPSTTERDVQLADAFLRWLDGLDERPFFAHVHLMSPHHPYDPPPPYDRFVPDPTHRPVTVYPRKSYFFFDEGEPLDAAALADMVARYDGSILFVDEIVGRILAGLDGRGLRDETLVVLTSDHGEEFYDHRNWGHGQSVYDELARIPLLVRHPRTFPAGARVERPVMLVDVMPTILELAGAGPLDGLPGRSLLTRPDAPEASDEALVELIYRYGWASALVRGQEKVVRMVRGEDDRTTLYDLVTDPGEQRPRPADGSELPERMQAVRAWADEHRSAPADEVEIDAEMEQRLKALGYLE
jgi:arylsulfatase A-like enzyme